MFDKMTGVIIHGAVGSGKTTKAKELAGEKYIFYTANTSFGSLVSGKTIIVDNVDTLKESVLKNIVKYTKGNLILTCVDLGNIPKDMKAKMNKVKTGNVDYRKKKTMSKSPASGDSYTYNDGIFKILENIYGNPDRQFVEDMLNETKQDVFTLVNFMAENGDEKLVAYLETLLFKVKPKVVYGIIAHGVPVRRRRIKWPQKKWPDKSTVDFMRENKLRFSDAVLLKEFAGEKHKVEKFKIKQVKKVVNSGGSDQW